MEKACRNGRRTARAIESVPEFQAHLRRNNIDFKTFEKQQALGAAMQPDTEADALNLARRKINFNQQNRKRKMT